MAKTQTPTPPVSHAWTSLQRDLACCIQYSTKLWGEGRMTFSVCREDLINALHNNNSSLNVDDPPLPSDIPSNPRPNIRNNSEFVNTWSSQSTDSFEAFSFQCEKFAEAVVEEAKSKSTNPTRPIQRSNRPNNRDINRNRPRVLPNPITARRIQTLYRLSRKRAARQILNDNNTVYSGTKDQSNEYFTTTFSSNPIDIDEVLESLNRHVPSADEDPTIMEPMSEKVIKDKRC